MAVVLKRGARRLVWVGVRVLIAAVVIGLARGRRTPSDARRRTPRGRRVRRLARRSGVSGSFIWKPAADSTFSVANGRCAAAAQPPSASRPAASPMIHLHGVVMTMSSP
jgi:hypothetical protein